MVNLNIQLPENFLNEEVRCDYTVTASMKEIWAVQLDLLQELLRVCKKHDIKIFAEGGTMLGAVRHKGFIPWDDDIDMMMFREDYDKLCALADEFQYPYFFQTEYTDPGSLRGHAQLRNSLTTGILKEELDSVSFNQGIFIDIFPLDSVVEDERLLKRQSRRVKRYKNLARLAFIATHYQGRSGGVKGFLKKMIRFFFKPLVDKFNLEQTFYQKFEAECARYNTVETEYVSPLSFQFDAKQNYKPRADYLETIEYPFEFMSIPIGKNYHRTLTKQFGNYMEFVKGTSCHGGVIFNTDTPYTTYLTNLNLEEKGKENEQ